MAEPIGALRAELSANAAQFEKDMGRARGSVRKFGNTAATGFGKAQTAMGAMLASLKAMAAPLLAIAGPIGLGLLFKNAVKTGDAIAKTARNIGITTSALQELRFAAEQSGIENAELDKGLLKLGKVVGELRVGYSSTIELLLKDYNPALVETLKNSKSLDEAFVGLVKGLESIDDPLARQAIQVAAFGRAGQKFTVFIEGGLAGIQALRQELVTLGGVLSEDALKTSEELNDAFNRVSKAIGVSFKAAVLEAGPAILKLTDGILFMTRVLKASAQGWGIIIDKIKELIKLRGALGALGFEGVSEPPTPPGPPGQERPGPPVPLLPIKEEPKDQLLRLKGAADLVGQSLEDARKELAAFNQTLEAEGRQIFIATRTEAEKFSIGMDRLGVLFQTRAIDAQTYDRALEQLEDEFVRATDGAGELDKGFTQLQLNASLFATTVSSSMAQAIVNSDNLGDAFVNLARQLAGMVLQAILFQAIMGAVGGIFGGGGGGGSTGLSGFSNFFGFQRGGIVPGPLGAPQLAIVHGGEMVTPATGDQVQGGNIIVQNQFFPGLKETIRAEVFTLLPLISDHTTHAVIAARGRGGQMARAMGQRG